jgi:hypothetical protein
MKSQNLLMQIETDFLVLPGGVGGTGRRGGEGKKEERKEGKKEGWKESRKERR